MPTYFQKVRGELPVNAGWLVAPQGFGAMLTMPIAGALVDRSPVGRIVPFGLVLITGGMFTLTQITATSSYWGFTHPGALFVMGLGMGATMMPIMTSALKTLTAHQVARGSTLLNITQQIASSIGVATMSVVLTSGLKGSALVQAGQALQADPAAAKDPGIAALLQQYGSGFEAAVREALAGAFAHTYAVAAVLVALTLIPAFFLPRKHEESHLLDDEGLDEAPAPVVLH